MNGLLLSLHSGVKPLERQAKPRRNTVRDFTRIRASGSSDYIMNSSHHQQSINKCCGDQTHKNLKLVYS